MPAPSSRSGRRRPGRPTTTAASAARTAARDQARRLSGRRPGRGFVASGRRRQRRRRSRRRRTHRVAGSRRQGRSPAGEPPRRYRGQPPAGLPAPVPRCVQLRPHRPCSRLPRRPAGRRGGNGDGQAPPGDAPQDARQRLLRSPVEMDCHFESIASPACSSSPRSSSGPRSNVSGTTRRPRGRSPASRSSMDCSADWTEKRPELLHTLTMQLGQCDGQGRRWITPTEVASIGEA